MDRRYLRPVAVVAVLGITVTVFANYLSAHPEVWDRLKHTSPGLLILLLALYLGTMAALALNTYATARLCRLKLPLDETFLVTAYNAVINFFGPLQSGPAFRAVYLKKKYGLNLKNYAVASLFYMFFYGCFSALFLISGLLKWWLAPLIVAGVICLLIGRKSPLIAKRIGNLDLGGWYYLALASLAQVCLIAAIYYAELRSIAPSTTLSQAIVYTGAANLALYVSITPGAIGFRESFLLFSQNLHDVSSQTIVAASLLDRAAYVILLLLLAAFIFASHAQRGLKKIVAR